MILFIVLSIPVLISLCVAVYNLITSPVFKKLTFELQSNPLVSILIPARNEEKNIKQCLQDVLNQTYTNIEILVLDDESTDNTHSIVEGMANQYSTIKLIGGKPLPENVNGKNWACAQLAEIAKGDYLLFIDADVRITPNTVESSLIYFAEWKTDLLSVFPSQIISGFGEWLVVPLMNWLLLSFLPLKKVFDSKNISFLAANGQFFMWKKNAYKKTGGHLAASDYPVEDMYLARAAKKDGSKVLTLLGGDSIHCRMYSNIFEAITGFSKNFYPGFRTSFFSFSLLIIVLFSVNVLPFLLVPGMVVYFIPIAGIIIIRIIVSVLSKQNVLLNIILHPFQMVIMILTGIISMIQFNKKTIRWKGRIVLK